MNTIEIKVVTDYTEFTNTVRFQLAVPVSGDDAKAIYKDLNGGDWTKTESDITTAVKKSAPSQVVSVVESLLKAYSGSSDASGDASKDSAADASTHDGGDPAAHAQDDG